MINSDQLVYLLYWELLLGELLLVSGIQSVFLRKVKYIPLVGTSLDN